MAKTAEVTVKIDKEQVDEWAKQRIEELEHSLKLSENRANKYVKQRDKARSELKKAVELASLAESFVYDVYSINPEIADGLQYA